jgi:hypothetical protein
MSLGRAAGLAALVTNRGSFIVTTGMNVAAGSPSPRPAEVRAVLLKSLSTKIKISDSGSWHLYDECA